ncbi:hypothetical protein MN608_09932 [Microdochium nivale]|nr:hypothetical protein MN608_09932 [Microdochium nivale]
MYRFLNIKYISVHGSVAKLLDTLARNPVLATRVYHILAPGEPVVFDGDVYKVLSLCDNWLGMYYSDHFAAYFVDQIHAKSSKSIDSTVALLAVLTPNLISLSWKPITEDNVLVAVLKYPAYAMQRPKARLENMLLSSLTEFTFLRGASVNIPDVVWHHTQVQPFLLAPGLQQLRLKHFRSNELLPLGLLGQSPQSLFPWPATTELRYLHLSHSAMHVQFFRQLLARSPHLRNLAVTFHAFRDGFLNCWIPFSPGHPMLSIMSYAEFGKALRDYGGSLVSLKVLPSQSAGRDLSAEDQPTFVGSLTSLTRLKELTIDPSILTDYHADSDDPRSPRLKDLLPSSLRHFNLRTLSPNRESMEWFGSELPSCMARGTPLVALERVAFITRFQRSREICRQLIPQVPRGWAYREFHVGQTEGPDSVWVRSSQD